MPYKRSYQRTIITGIATLAVAVAGTAITGGPAGASATLVTSSPSKGLLTTAQAARLGFAKVVGKPTSSTKTGVAKCPKGAQVAYEDKAGATGLISEVLVCKSPSGPAGLITKAKKSVAAAAVLKPPKQLGSTAIELAEGSTYAIYWQRGSILELVALDANVPASSSSTTTTSGPATPLTASQRQALTKAALQQDATVK